MIQTVAIDPAMRADPTYKNFSSKANWTLTFKATGIPALGFKTYFVSKNKQAANELPTSRVQSTTRKVDLSAGPYELKIETDVSHFNMLCYLVISYF